MLNALDLAIIGVLLLSALLAAWRGFTKEVLSIGAWVGAAIVMFIFGPKAAPLFQPYLEKDILAQIAGFATVFVLALLPLSYISYRIAEGVRASAIGPVDRVLGLAFGAARGLVIVGVGFLVFTSLVSETRYPGWFKEARLYPLMSESGGFIASLLPAEIKLPGTDAPTSIGQPVIGGRPAKPAAEPAREARPQPRPAPREEPAPRAPAPAPREAETAPKPTAKPAAPKPQSREAEEDQRQGYGERDRNALDQLIGSSQGDGQN